MRPNSEDLNPLMSVSDKNVIEKGACVHSGGYLCDPIRMAEENNVERRKTKINNKQATSTQYIVVAIMQ